MVPPPYYDPPPRFFHCPREWNHDEKIRKMTVCPEWLASNYVSCSMGDACSKPHPDPGVVQIQDLEVEVCSDFLGAQQENNQWIDTECVMGDVCERYHPEPHLIGKVRKDVEKGLPRAGGRVGAPSDGRDERGMKKGICRDWENGTCNRGSGCKFAHSGGGSPARGGPRAAGGGPPRGGDHVPARGGIRDTAATHHMAGEMGNDRRVPRYVRGENDGRRDDRGDYRARSRERGGDGGSNARSGVDECGDFKRGKCFRGDTCKFSHDVKPDGRFILASRKLFCVIFLRRYQWVWDGEIISWGSCWGRMLVQCQSLYEIFG